MRNFGLRTSGFGMSEYDVGIVTNDFALVWINHFEDEDKMLDLSIKLLEEIKIRRQNDPKLTLMYQAFYMMGNEIMRPYPKTITEYYIRKNIMKRMRDNHANTVSRREDS